VYATIPSQRSFYFAVSFCQVELGIWACNSSEVNSPSYPTARNSSKVNSSSYPTARKSSEVNSSSYPTAGNSNEVNSSSFPLRVTRTRAGNSKRKTRKLPASRFHEYKTYNV